MLPCLSGTLYLSVAPKSDAVRSMSVKDYLTDPTTEKNLETTDNNTERCTVKLTNNIKRREATWRNDAV